MANTKRRTNISLDTKLFKRATAYGQENGRSLSSLIEQGLRCVLDGPPVPAEHGNLSSVPLPDIDAITSRIDEQMPQIIMTWLETARGAEHLERLIVPYVNERVAVLKGRAAPPGTATPKPTAGARTSTPEASARTQTGARQTAVDVPPDVRERLQKFSIPQLVEATGMGRSDVSRFRSGYRSRIQQATYDRLMAGLEQLESR